jgi:hypothetical protein
MTLAEEYRETRDWIVAHRRDPFLWGTALLLAFLVMGTIIGGVLPKVFSHVEARDTIAKLGFKVVGIKSQFLCRAHGLKVYGYAFQTGTDNTDENYSTGKICWDMSKHRWEWVFDRSQFARFNSDPNRR